MAMGAGRGHHFESETLKVDRGGSLCLAAIATVQEPAMAVGKYLVVVEASSSKQVFLPPPPPFIWQQDQGKIIMGAILR